MSVRLRQSKHSLTNITANHLATNRGNARNKSLPQISLDVILPRVSHPAMAHHCSLTCPKCCFGSEVFGRICVFPRRVARIIHPGRLIDHQPRSFQVHPRVSEWMLNALALPNRSPEHLSLVCVFCRASQRRVA
ncbi:hypothetical protein I7I50_05884 [Histoplasma capsulatum G186AR]|uniref:Uncharacterized protein n=1 Tax=Ajellomyces capsulatus TaxID=5037 RepID=A0A8H7Z7B6_AJECA|nr:hypothetical protein I7I52_04143 [Histoplasma capsulatum]QSS76432.1 hypothetical protein I7I50_05884 [Histoplasma capsulatum G186AR]